LTNVKEFLVPIPPESEQQRIATTVERVFNWISQLEEQQQAREIVSTKFAKAAIDAITSTEFTEIERMKPPKTEIVTALKIASKPQKADVAPLAVLLSEQDGVSTAKSLWKYSGLEIDAFYRQLKTEITNGWIEEDTSKRSVKEVEVG
jgi:type I restriction enzyme S subunit